jgi:hypothetical protein
MTEDEEIPEYLKKLSKGGPIKPDGGFGPEDMAWTGSKGELDPDAIIDERGQDPFNTLQLLLMALVRGYSRDASSQEVLSRTQTALAAITGEKPRRGAIERDYHALLQEVAWRYFVALVDNNMSDGDIELQPIVREVLGADTEQIAAEHGVEPDNLPKILATKFNEAKDLYLSRATTDDDWARIRAFPELNAAIKSLVAAGIPIDQTALKPTRLAKNHKK